MTYEFEKKEATAKLEQEKKDAIALEESQKQKIVRNAFIAGFILMMILAVFIFRSYRNKQKANKIILSQKNEVEKQKTIVDQKQKQIVDSINYAQRIQNSILVSEQEIQKQFQNCFVFYKPRGIVSGDFYWFSEVESSELGVRSSELGGASTSDSQQTKHAELKSPNTELIVVCADCTGHGVPGAFLSMVGNTLLNEIVTHNKITDPAEIIKKLSIGLSATLKNKEGEENTDGMDISICKINLNTKKIQFAGANQSLYIVNNDGVKKIEPQINSINGILGLNENEKINSLEIIPSQNSMIYLTSDGYTDQIGEKSLKKYLGGRFEKTLSEIFNHDITEQKTILEKNLMNWKGKMNQVDDVLVMGFRI